jgi:acyl carrier protein
VAVVAAGLDQVRTLVAFVCTNTPLDTAELRRDLERSLPRHMVPGHIVELPVFPTLTSGKTDRRGLARMAEALIAKAPTQTAEGHSGLLDIWCRALAVAAVSDSSDFFALGGDSLAAAAIICASEEAFGVSIPLRMLYDNPTLGGFRGALETRKAMTGSKTRQ